MYIIAFESELLYKQAVCTLKENHIKPTLTGDPWQAVARHEARAVVDIRLPNYEKLYYDDEFSEDALVESITEAISESDLKDQFYQEASDEFDNQVKDLLGDTDGI